MLRITLTGVLLGLLLTVWGCSRGGKPAPMSARESLMKELADVTDEGVNAVAAIKDQASAKAAAETMKKAAQRSKQLLEQIKALGSPAAEEAQAVAKYIKQRQNAFRRLGETGDYLARNPDATGGNAEAMAAIVEATKDLTGSGQP